MMCCLAAGRLVRSQGVAVGGSGRLNDDVASGTDAQLEAERCACNGQK